MVEYRVLGWKPEWPFTLDTAYTSLMNHHTGAFQVLNIEKDSFETLEEARDVLLRLRSDWPKQAWALLKIWTDQDDPYHIEIRKLHE